MNLKLSPTDGHATELMVWKMCMHKAGEELCEPGAGFRWLGQVVAGSRRKSEDYAPVGFRSGCPELMGHVK